MARKTTIARSAPVHSSGQGVTIMDIARLVGVTDATVSNALNSKGRVSEATRQRVLDAAREMDYTSNALARGLKTGRTHTIVVLASHLHSQLTAIQLHRIDLTARKRGYNLLIASNDFENQADIKSLVARGIDGIIASAGAADNQPHLHAALESSGLPYVYSYRAADEDNAAAGCAIDQHQGGVLAGQRLIATGRKRLVYVGGSATMRVTNERLSGFKAALSEADIFLDDGAIFFNQSHLFRDGIATAESILRRRPLPDGIFAATDTLAFGVMRMLHKGGIRVPDDIALIGFDNTAMCEITEPSLTSIDMPVGEGAERATNALLDHLENKDSRGLQPLTILSPSIVLRESA